MTRALLGDEEVSDEVLQLVETVGRLASADQERILRIVRLLSIAPGRIQVTTQRMLRRLADGHPSAVYTTVDQVIEYLESNILADADLVPDEDPYLYLPVSRLHN